MGELSNSTRVCIVGGGPAGVIAAYLFALRGIRVVLLEGQQDFDRDCRGDTLHASSLEILQQLGLVDEVLDQATSRISKLSIAFGQAEINIADFFAMQSDFPYVAIIPQAVFLNLVVEKARSLPEFTVLMGAQVRELSENDGRITGVEYTHAGESRSLSADLVIGADGRGSSIRKLAGLTLGKTSPPMDVIWFRLSLPDGEKIEDVNGRIGSGHMLVIIGRRDHLQVGVVIMKGSYKALREEGIESFHEMVTRLAPELRETITEIKDWSQMAILPVVTGRVERWYREGLLLIGDAAHVMSPVGGVGINYAIQDAVAAVNLLADSLSKGGPGIQTLAEVQERRESAVSTVQRFQSLVQQRVIKAALSSGKTLRPPLPLRIISRIPYARKRIARFLAYGTRHESVEGL